MTMMIMEYLKALFAGMIVSAIASVAHVAVMMFLMARELKGSGMLDFRYQLHHPRFALLVSVAFAVGMFLALRFIVAPPMH